jgi:hypothetical protein
VPAGVADARGEQEHEPTHDQGNHHGRGGYGSGRATGAREP